MAEKQDIKAFQRVLKTDLDGNKPISRALLKIQGIGFSMANALCTSLKIPKSKKAGLLSPEEVKKIEGAVEQGDSVPPWMLNRRKDFDTGKDKHMTGPDLKLSKEFDIKRLKKTKSYVGMRHQQGRPVRGQRTRSNFRKGKSIGVAKSKAKR